MIRYYVTDRKQADIYVCANRAIQGGVDMIQIREKDLPGREILELASHFRQLAEGTGTKVLVNDRLDVALAAGIDGVHLPSNGLPPGRVRPLVPILGVSAHSVEAAIRAEEAGADFIVFGPVFETPGKTPVGLKALGQVTAAVTIPVLAIGGVTASNAQQALDVGAAGIAAIRMFQAEV